MNPASPVHASKRNGAKLEILSDDDNEIESNYERADANPGKNESSNSMAPKVYPENADDESEHI